MCEASSPARPDALLVCVGIALRQIPGANASDSVRNGRMPRRRISRKKRRTRRRRKERREKGLPLKSDRKIEFTTDEGTWLSLDVSRTERRSSSN